MISIEELKQAIAEITDKDDLFEIQRLFIQDLANGEIKTLEGAMFVAKLIDNRKL